MSGEKKQEKPANASVAFFRDSVAIPIKPPTNSSNVTDQTSEDFFVGSPKEYERLIRTQKALELLTKFPSSQSAQRS